MARATNGLGQFRGKLGSVVFRVSEGQQIASAYQPQVRNPKSNLQTAQRNKLFLASQLNRLVSDYDIAGLGSTPRARRSEFMRNILINAVSTLNNATFVTSIKGDKVLFSKGNPSILRNLITVSGVTIDIDFQNVNSEDVSNLALKMVEVIIENGVYKSVSSYYRNLPAVGSHQGYDVGSIESGKKLLYAVPIKLKEGYRVVNQQLTQLQFDSATGESKYVVVGKYYENAASYQYYESFLVGSWGDSGAVELPSGGEDSVVNPDAPSFYNAVNTSNLEDNE